MTAPLLEVRHLSVDFRPHGGRGEVVHAVADVNLSVTEGQTYGLVGESGSGKSTLARAALALIPRTGGQAFLAGTEMTASRGRVMRAARRNAGVVFQNPVAALNPRLKVRALVAEPLRLQGETRRDARRQVETLLDQVGLAATYADRLPHELSGGQCQRVGIARALATRPRLLILDEPTSALDVSVQAQILNLLLELKHEQELTYLLISHDLDVVQHMSDVVGVMYRGRIVEEGPAQSLLATPGHPYTARLLAAIPGGGREQLIREDPDHAVPSPAQSAGSGCAFLGRCPVFRSTPMEVCNHVAPQLQLTGDSHSVACFAAAVSHERSEARR
jgi:oligopeptide transport system ATP-binding protein